MKQSILDIEYSIYSYRSCCTYLFAVSISEKTLRKPRFNWCCQTAAWTCTRLPALRERIALTFKSSNTCACAHGGFSAKYACAQLNVGVSSAVFRSGVSSVQWQLEQKKVPCYSVLSVLKHGPEIELTLSVPKYIHLGLLEGTNLIYQRAPSHISMCLAYVRWIEKTSYCTCTRQNTRCRQ